MTVEQRSDGWVVIAGEQVLAGPFATNAQAWRWIDRHDGEPISSREKVSQWMYDDDH
jgi:hypothetical protein